MVTDELTVPCNSLSNLYSHGPSVFFFSMLFLIMVITLQYTIIAMQESILSLSSVKFSVSQII